MINGVRSMKVITNNECRELTSPSTTARIAFWMPAFREEAYRCRVIREALYWHNNLYLGLCPAVTHCKTDFNYHRVILEPFKDIFKSLCEARKRSVCFIELL